jgi:hypothetical protein
MCFGEREYGARGRRLLKPYILLFWCNARKILNEPGAS